jgi:type I restriction enzyme S subunit
MSLTLKPYPEYKDSGVPWLGEIPSHWITMRGKSLFSESHLPVHARDEIVTCFRDGQVTLRKHRRTQGFMMALLETGYQGVRRGQLVIHSMDAFAGALGVSDSDGKCTPEYIVCYPRSADVLPEYYAHTLRTMAQQDYIRIICPAVRERAPRIRYSSFGDMLLPVPPVQEQEAISRYLHLMQHQTNRLVRAKRRLIELLNEQKYAIIHQAVTCGLDPTVRLKPSGIDWLGDVPEHWEVKTLKQIAVVRLSGVDKHTAEGETSVRLCNYTDVYNRDQIDSEISFMVATAREAEIADFSLRAGDVLITKDSETPNDIAVPALVTETLEDVICGYHLALIRPDEKEMSGEYLFHAFCAPSLARQFSVAANGVTRYGLSKHAIKTAIVTVPPIKEQRAICEWIARHLEPIVTSVNRAHREIDLLREYRTRLIAEVVTGKLDVRGVELPVLDETDVVEDWETGEDAEAGEMVEIEGVDA